MTNLTGFTEAELAAFEWSKRQKEQKRSSKSDTNLREQDNKPLRPNIADRNSTSSDNSGDFKRSDSASNSSERSPLSDHRTNYGRSRRRKNTYGRSTISSTSSSYSPSRRHTKTYRGIRKSHEYSSRYIKSPSKRHGRSGRSRTRSFSRSSEGFRSPLESSDSSDDLPRDPFNPLNLAYSHRYHRISHRRIHRSRDRSNYDSVRGSRAKNDYDQGDRWKHDLYESDSERVSREAQIKKNRLYGTSSKSSNKPEADSKLSNRTDNYSDTGSDAPKHGGSSSSKNKLITKRGWKSRAGGVYIPGDEDEDLYYDHRKSVSYERPDPSYTLD